MGNRSGGPQKRSSVRWGDLHDPRPESARTSITLGDKAWRHIVEKHIVPGREPWGNLFPDEVFKNLMGACVPVDLTDPAVTVFEEQVRQSLERPLVLLYEVRSLGGAQQEPLQTWCVVCPAGAVAYVADRGKHGNYLLTCYFPKAAAVERNREQRWRRVIRALVVRYGVWDSEQRALRLPEEHIIRFSPKNGPVRQLHSAIRFVTPASWGFCPELAGVPWRGRLTAWAAAPPPKKSTGRRHRLKPRRRND